MKLLVVLMLCAFAAAVPSIAKQDIFNVDLDAYTADEGSRNILINILIRQFFNYIRYIINNGSIIFGLPPLDPLEISSYKLYLPMGLINLDLDLKDAVMTGLGGFVVHTSNFVPSALTFDLEISVPSLVITCEDYDLTGDLFGGIPLYGKGKAFFQVDGFRFRALVYLKRSEDGQSVLIDRIDNASYEIPSFKSELTGVIGGGDIDAIVNAIIEEVIVDYANRFQGGISALVALVLPMAANPILDQLDTWKYIDRFV